MAKMIFLECKDDEYIQINRSFSLNKLMPSQLPPDKWAISAFYDGKGVSYMQHEYGSRDECVLALKDLVYGLTQISS